MLVDAHCHPFDLKNIFKESEQQRKDLGVLAVASACFPEDLIINDDSILPCFGIHPQLPAIYMANNDLDIEKKLNDHIQFLRNLTKEKKIAAIGECGFDLFNAAYKETEIIQDRLFTEHLEIALQYNLPIVLHVRRAIHKIFTQTKTLSKCKSVIFHHGPALMKKRFHFCGIK